MPNKKQDSIESLAREIYGLIWDHRDDEAVIRLRELGEDAVPVAHALVNGNYRWPPLLTRIGNALVGTFVCSFVIVPVVYSICWDVPDIYTGQKWLFYFGLSGGCVVGELFGGSFLEMFLSSRRFVKIRDEADQKKLDIAASVLSDSPSENSDLAQAILDALRARNCTYSAPVSPIDFMLERALTNALDICSPEVILNLTDQQRRDIGYKLGAVEDRIEAVEVDSVGESDAAALGIVLIKTCLHIPSRDRVERVRDIAKQELETIGRHWAPLVKYAIETLPQLEESLRCLEGKDVLLRSSLAEANAHVELVRAAIQPGETPAEELLRAAE